MPRNEVGKPGTPKRSAPANVQQGSSSWVMHGRGWPDFVVAIQCDVCQRSNHENHSDNQRHGLTTGI